MVILLMVVMELNTKKTQSSNSWNFSIIIVFMFFLYVVKRCRQASRYRYNVCCVLVMREVSMVLYYLTSC